ncbi:MAG TPA: carboxymuconolactone decarboxylase family protein [Vicinamibacterales bacterium]|nr:carboxymuconolactone decarboxylase family protein [Vicinamibacterales bacterium]
MRLTSLLLVLATALVAGQSTLDSDSHARLPFLQRKDMSEADQKIFDVLPGRGKDDVLRGPLAFAAYNPAAAKALFDLHNAAVAGTLNAHVRELAIMVACRETHYNLEWNGHEPTALKNGVDATLLDVIRRRAPLTGVDEKDAAVVRLGRQMFGDKKVEPATFAKIVELYGRRGAMDMVAVMNTYAVSGFFAIAVDEQPAPGKSPL